MSWWTDFRDDTLDFLGFGGDDDAEAPERMSYSEAYSRAQDVLTPQYKASREGVLENIDTNLISRGFYGQAPGDAMKASTMADMENDFQSQLAQYATSLQNNQFTQDYQTYQLELQEQQNDNAFWNTVGSLAGSFLGGPGGDALFTWLIS